MLLGRAAIVASQPLEQAMNRSGHKPTLVVVIPETPTPCGTASSRHAYSSRERGRSPTALMAAAHTSPLDRSGEEIGALVALIEAADRDLAERGITRKGETGLCLSSAFVCRAGSSDG